MARSARGKTNRSRAATRRPAEYGQRLLSDALSISGSLLRSQMSHGAEKLQTFAEATRDYADSLGDVPGLKGYVALAAESVDALSEYVAQTELEDMISDASAFARRQPLATLLVAVSAGLVATFVIRAQMSSSAWPEDDRPRPRRAPRGPRKAAAKRRPRSRAQGGGPAATEANA